MSNVNDNSTTPPKSSTETMMDNVNKEMSKLDIGDDQQLENTLHPLQNEWTLFYVPPAETNHRTSSSFAKTGFNEIYTIKSVEEFWSLFAAIKKPKEFKKSDKADLHLFKNGILPKWEHEGNRGGGTFKIENVDNKDIDDIWTNCMLACISETLEDEFSDFICGCSLNIRRHGKRVELWTKNADDKDAMDRVKRRFEKFLELNSKHKRYNISFTSHEQAEKGGPQRKSYHRK